MKSPRIRSLIHFFRMTRTTSDKHCPLRVVQHPPHTNLPTGFGRGHDVVSAQERRNLGKDGLPLPVKGRVVVLEGGHAHQRAQRLQKEGTRIS